MLMFICFHLSNYKNPQSRPILLKETFLASFRMIFDVCFWKYSLNPFHATGLVLYSLKMSKHKRFSDVFRRYSKRPLALNGLTR